MVRAVVFLEVEEGGQDRDEEFVKVYLKLIYHYGSLRVA